jgi:hypothetical protein
MSTTHQHGLLGAIKDEARHLHDIERKGDAPETPFIALTGVFLSLLPTFAFVVTLALIGYYTGY